MIRVKEKNAGDTLASARLFDAETRCFGPARTGSAKFHRIVVEISSIAGSKLRQFRRLNPAKLVSCAVQFPVKFRPAEIDDEQ